ncbi:MAG3090 family protein [Mycoplasmopsis opalescens]|uniref:MAG3090 family protein n=1 Tax=Mycoplasmopsis opalescens TaxID=114886 RepID=UPI0004A7552B|nr:hypothetical protein [Mycoplasmopsis opalescens]
MKRLNLTYEKAKDKKYPWLLKHPKIKSGLAKFKTREDAINWYLTLDFETAIWFQAPNKIFGGQLTTDKDEKNVWRYYVKTKGFDGGDTYTETCEQWFIDPATALRKKGASKTEGFDYVELHDPQTYFPAELEVVKKEVSKVDLVDIEEIKKSINERVASFNREDIKDKNLLAQVNELIDAITKEGIKDDNIDTIVEKMQEIDQKMVTEPAPLEGFVVPCAKPYAFNHANCVYADKCLFQGGKIITEKIEVPVVEKVDVIEVVKAEEPVVAPLESSDQKATKPYVYNHANCVNADKCLYDGSQNISEQESKAEVMQKDDLESLMQISVNENAKESALAADETETDSNVIAKKPSEAWLTVINVILFLILIGLIVIIILAALQLGGIGTYFK